MMTLALLLLVTQDGAPWRTDLDAARAEALRSARPCVILFRVESRAL
jgi:hypothetical protein